MDQPPPSSGDDPFTSIVAVLSCLTLSFLFSGSETAITSMGEHRVRRLIENKQGPTRLFELWLHDHSKVLTAILAGNTLVNIAVSSLVTSMALAWTRGHSSMGLGEETVVSIAIAMLTLAVLISGEIVPKTMAKSRPEWFLRLLWLVYWFLLATSWLTAGLTWLSKVIARLLGVETHASGFVVTEEQIEDMVRIGAEEGSIDLRRGDLLKNVFDLWDTSMRAIMTPRTDMVGIPLGASVEEILRIVKENGYSRYPVFDGGPDHVVGIFYAKQLIEAEAEIRLGRFDLRRHLRPPLFVPETQKASTLLQTFRARAVHVAVVVDEHGGTAGIVSLEDILEELVGDIYDEFDEIEPTLDRTDDGVFRVDGATDVRTLTRALGIELPEEDEGYATVAGYILHHLGRMPAAGDTMEADGMQLTVLEVDARKIRRVEVRPLQPPPASPPDAPDGESARAA